MAAVTQWKGISLVQNKLKYTSNNNILYEKVGLEGNSGVKKEGNKGIIIGGILIRPLFPSFLHHYCPPILYVTNFLIENVFITCFMCF